MIASQEEFRCQEKAWFIEVASLQANQGAINEEIGKARFELSANQLTIHYVCQTIAKAQAILEASQMK